MIDQLAHCARPACNRPHQPSRATQRYCSDACGETAHDAQAYSLNPVMYPPGAPTVQKWCRCGRMFVTRFRDQETCSLTCAERAEGVPA